MRRISLQLILSVLFHLGWIPHQWGWPRVYIFLPLPFVKIAKLVLNRSLQSDAVGRVFLPENWTVLYRDQFWSPTFYENSESNHLMSHKSKDWTLTLYQRTQTLWSPYPSSEFQTHEIEDMWKEETTTYLKTKVFHKDSKGYLKLQVKINLSVGLWMWGLREEPSKHSWVQRVCFLLKWALCYYMFSWVGADYYLSILEQIPGFIAVVLRRRGW